MSDTKRTEAFSDGVLAIAITLLVLDLSVPARNELHGGSLAHALAREWPAYGSYVTSFLIIGIIWVNHHTVFQLIGRIDRIALFLNLLLLMTVVTIPYTTHLLATYLTAGSGARTAAIVYSAVMLAMSCAFAGLYAYIAHRPALLAEGVDPVAVRASIVRFSAVGLALYVATVVVAIFSAPLCLLAHFAIALYYCFSQIRTGPSAADATQNRQEL